MSALIATAATMSSREISNLVESRHDSVKRTIDRLANQGVIQLPPLVDVKNHLGQGVSEFVFSGEQGKRDSIVVVAQLSPEFTARLVDRWQELEARASRPIIPQSLAEALRLAADLAEQKAKVEAALTLAAPKAEIHDRIADAEGSVTIRETANTLQVPERKFVLWLLQNDWCYRRAGHKSLLAYADKVKAGYLVLKQMPIRDAHTGEERLSEQVRVTPLGLTALARRLSRESGQVEMPAAVIARTGVEYATRHD